MVVGALMAIAFAMADPQKNIGYVIGIVGAFAVGFLIILPVLKHYGGGV